MSFEQDTIKITARFTAQMTSLLPSMPVDQPNTKFSLPADNGEYVRLAVLRGTSRHAGTGGGQQLYRNPGVIIVQVFYPLDRGEGDILRTCDIIAGMFRGWRDGDLHAKAASINTVGKTDNGYYQVNVEIPFTSDHKH